MFLKDQLTSKILSSSKIKQVLDIKDEQEQAFTVTVGKADDF